ncbi:Dipeptidyl aminopeptidase/acylaminoacyl peptidase [Sphingomonas guangdongensis]|uniref:Dipeptidyl aminopeptidase/acylaminoacyl peptidase n=1 Tax=Sphingomonas guangdongensis TaxID=1141890 RepID=A0A285QGB0_9SPHN|nr:prolyl oligopeptidase family serine peptidase [Sphingomonas guangdongensis]SOB80861.1 Dipeptidyl aminopeptidase/acylaminoacyl peptidase [Sphingomonas guangdongensis]
MSTKGWIAVALAAAQAASPAPAQDRGTNPAAAWATKPVPIEVSAQFPQLAGPRLSPDGKIVAAKVRAGGGQVLALFPLGNDSKPVIVGRDGAEGQDRQGDRQIRAWRWVDDDHLLLTITYRDNYLGDWFDNLRYVMVNRATGRSVPLGWTDSLGPTQLLWPSPSGPPRVLLQRVPTTTSSERFGNPEVIAVDGETGRSSVVVRSNPIVSRWTADSAGIVRIGSSYNRENGRLRLLYRAREDEPFRTFTNETGDRYDGSPAPDMILAGPNAKAYSYSRKDGFRALYEYNLETMALGSKVYGVAGYDIGNGFLNAARDRLAGVVVTTDRERTTYFDPRMKEIQALLEKAAGAGNISIISSDKAQEKIIYAQARSGQAPGYYLFDTVSGDIKLIGWENRTLGNAQLNAVTTIRYPTSDGRQVEAVLTMPRHHAGRKALPLVVMPHGGPRARDSADWDPYNWSQAVAELGYVVVQPNFLGSSGYGREWEKGAEGKWGYRMSDDLNEAVAFLARQGTVDPARTCIMGWSYGGYAAARAAQRDGKTYRCAIAGAAPVDMAAMVAYDRGYLGSYGAKAALGSASSNLADISGAPRRPDLHPTADRPRGQGRTRAGGAGARLRCSAQEGGQGRGPRLHLPRAVGEHAQSAARRGSPRVAERHEVVPWAAQSGVRACSFLQCSALDRHRIYLG